MFNTLKKRIKNEKGLSLVELLAVIVILAIVAAIAIPAIGNIINNQRDKAILSDISGLVSASKIAYADGACVDDVCTYSATVANNEVDFKSTKFAEGTVTFTDGNTADPAITVTLPATTTFKGKNKTAFDALITGGFTESELNTEMAK
ncbi:prepilin-type N-terminal cleavage/methylation domain-containing protein [Solibacillus sp. FSL K6-1781]|uniref:prepilin-type N-terminal cleavage/methylation domain-containing protein n=1 Tax=Solibacillus sp. FSL K6-1781 TaxID=2921474 RepID=UPI00315A0F88